MPSGSVGNQTDEHDQRLDEWSWSCYVDVIFLCIADPDVTGAAKFKTNDRRSLVPAAGGTEVCAA